MKNQVKYCHYCTTEIDPAEYQCDGCLKPLCNACGTPSKNFEQMCPDCVASPPMMLEA